MRMDAWSWLLLLLSSPAFGQTPQPFPRPGEPPQARSVPPAPPVSTDPPRRNLRQPDAAERRTAGDAAAERSECTAGARRLAFPIYPAAQFLASYDAGRGQRYYIFGTDDAIRGRRELLPHAARRERQPRVQGAADAHVRGRPLPRRDDGVPAGCDGEGLDVGRIAGLSEPEAGAQPARFPTIIMIVPPPPAAPAAR